MLALLFLNPSTSECNMLLFFFFLLAAFFLYFQSFNLDVSVFFVFFFIHPAHNFLDLLNLWIHLSHWFWKPVFCFSFRFFAALFCILSLYGTLITHIRSFDSISHTVGLLYSQVLLCEFNQL